jgi:hypothetical protein
LYRNHVHIHHGDDTRAFVRRQPGYVVLATIQVLLLSSEKDQTKILFDRNALQHASHLDQSCATAAIVVGSGRGRRRILRLIMNRLVDGVEMRGNEC